MSWKYIFSANTSCWHILLTPNKGIKPFEKIQKTRENLVCTKMMPFLCNCCWNAVDIILYYIVLYTVYHCWTICAFCVFSPQISNALTVQALTVVQYLPGLCWVSEWVFVLISASNWCQNSSSFCYFLPISVCFPLIYVLLWRTRIKLQAFLPELFNTRCPLVVRHLCLSHTTNRKYASVHGHSPFCMQLRA